MAKRRPHPRLHRTRKLLCRHPRLVASRSRHVDTLLSLLQHLLQTSLRLLHIILRLLHLADADARACGLISLGHLLLPQNILELLDLELLR